MRFLKWISMLTVFAMLCSVLPATVAEDEIAIDLEQTADDGLDLEVEGEGSEAFDDSALSLEDVALELDGLENDLLTSETEEQAQAPAVSNANGDFVIDENGVLTRYAGFDKNVVIPNGVKAIGGSAFYGYTAMESVSIPRSVTEIDSDAFEGCTGLKSITIPNSVVSIGWWAFSGCTNLKSISIPDSVTYIGGYAFSGCSSLTEIHLPANMKELEYGLFSDCDSLKNIDFLAGVTKISDSLFSSCDGLTSITCPSSVTSIGINVFGYCKNLESVTVHSGVTFIDRTAFEDSKNVTIRGAAGSYAETYAKGMGIPFNAPVVTIDEETYWIDDDSEDHYGIVVYNNHSRALRTLQKPADLARTLKWSSSNPNVATVDQNGKVKGISKGMATITAATADGKGKAAQIKILVPEPTTVELSYHWGDDKELILNQTSTISASRNVPYQYETKVEMPITWTSSDNSVISIESSTDEEAALKGKKLGKATITASTSDGGKASIELTVVRPEVESVKIEQSDPIYLYPGDQYSLTAVISPTEADQSIKWSSEDDKIAKVNKDGIVTAVAKGWTYIRAEANNGEYDSIEIEVRVPPKKIALDQTKVTVDVGESIYLFAIFTPDDAEANLTWSSSNKSIVEVKRDESAGGGIGKVTGLKPGTAKITVKTDNGKTATATITVKANPTKVKLNKTKATLGVKEKLTLKATFTPATAVTALTWSSSKPRVAAVDKKGVVTAVGKGTAVITVKAKNGKTAKATITVKAAPNRVTLNKSGTVTLKKGKTLKLKATLPRNTASTLTWSSSKPMIAKVDKNGVVTALAKGTAVITVRTFNKKTAKVTIRVN